MKRFALTFSVCALGICAPVAQAKNHTVAPSGYSGINEYVETIPTDHGNQPTRSIHNNGHTGSGVGGGINGGGGGGTAGGSGATGSGTSGGGGGSSGAISQSTQHALASQGAVGKAAAALALSTAPSQTRGAGANPNAKAGEQSSQPPTSGGSSALGSVAAALTGSGSTGGLGAALPVILIVVLFGSAGMAILRRRSHS